MQYNKEVNLILGWIGSNHIIQMMISQPSIGHNRWIEQHYGTRSGYLCTYGKKDRLQDQSLCGNPSQAVLLPDKRRCLKSSENGYQREVGYLPRSNRR